MKNNNLLKLFKTQKPTAGYTLIELLIGASISVVVIGAAGIGLMNLMRGNLAATNQTERRAEVNRALEFISDEVRRAEAIETEPDQYLPSGLTPTDKEIVLALEIPNLGQSTSSLNDKVIYYVAEKPSADNKWVGPRIIYRYGPPLDSSTGRYTNGGWTSQPLIDRISDQTIDPSVVDSSCISANNKQAISAQGFGACLIEKPSLDSDGNPVLDPDGTPRLISKVAKLFINGKFSEDSTDEYKADIQVFARAEAEHLNSNSSTVNFSMVTDSGQSKVKVIASEMGCSSNQIDYDSGNGSCTIETQIFPTDILPYDTSTNSYDSTDIATLNNPTNPVMNPINNSGDVDVSVGTDKPFIVRVKPSNDNITEANRFESYFEDDGTRKAAGIGDQNNNKSIEVEIDLSKDYLNDSGVVKVLGDFTDYQVKLLGDKTQISDLPTAWNLDQSDPKFKELVEILGDPNGDGSNDDTLLDGDNELKLEPNQYVLLFEVGQPYDSTKDTNGNGLVDAGEQHPGFDLQDHIMLITVQ